MLKSPYPIARAGLGVYRNLYALRPANWHKLEVEPPRNLAFTLTEHCNASCSFCVYRFGTPKDRMSNEVFFKAAGEYCDMGGKNIWLNALTGEPLLDPHFFEKTAFLRSLGGFESVNLTTNGIMLAKDHVIEALIGSGISHIIVSTAGFDRAIYRKHMGVDRYDEFLSGLVNLLRRNQETGYPLDVTVGLRGLMNVLDTEDFRTKVLPMINSGKGKVRVEFLRFYIDWFGKIKSEDLPEGCGFLPQVIVRTRPCNTSFNLGVLANGDLRVCHCGNQERSDDLLIGNVLTSSIVEAWHSDNAKKVRATTYGSGANDICRRCVMYSPVRPKEDLTTIWSKKYRPPEVDSGTDSEGGL